MCALGRLLLCFVVTALVSDHRYFSRTSLAPAFALQTKVGQSILETAVEFPEKQGSFNVASNSKTQWSSRIEYPTAHHECAGNRTMALPLPAGWSQKRSQQELLQSVRIPLQQGAMVDIREESDQNQVPKPKEEGQKKAGGADFDVGGWEGNQPVAAVWRRGSYSYDTMGYHHPQSNSQGSYAIQPEECREQETISGATTRRGSRETCTAQAEASRERRRRHGDSERSGRAREGIQGWSSYESVDAQVAEPTPESGTESRGHPKADTRFGCPLEEMERLHENKIRRARQALSREEEAAFREEEGIGYQNLSSTRRDTEGSPSPTDQTDRCGRLETSGDPGGFRSFRNQCIGRRERPGDGSWREEEQDNATSSRNTELSSKSGQNHVIFHEITQVSIFDDDATIGSPSFEFNIDHLALADWDSKPWALHPGTFTNAAARTILHGLCDDVPARDLHLHPCRVQGEGGQVPTGEPPWNGGQAQGVQLPHPAEGRDGDRDKDLRHDKVCELHGPAAASAILHGLCDGVPARDLHLHPCRVRGEGGQVPTGDLPWSGGQAQRDQLPHPVEGRDGDKDLRHDKVCELHGPDSDRKQSSQAKTCKIVSLGVYRGYIGKRIGRLRPQDIQDNEIVRGLLSELWSDYFDDHTTFHWPDPQPSQEKVLFIVVDFLPLHDVLHLGRVACLINVMGWNVDADSATNIVEAALVPERATWWEIIFDLGLQEQCRSRTGNQCLLRVGRRLILNDDPFIIPDRAAVVVNYDIADDEPPRVSLIQTQCYVKVCPGFSNEVDMSSGPPTTASSSSRSRPLPATSTSHRPALTTPGEPTDVPPEEATLLSASTRTYHLLHRTTDYQTATIDATDPFQERAQIATAWNVAPDVVIGIHPVRARPADFPDDGSIIVITRWVQDAELRAYPTDIQVLFDIEIHSGVAPSVDAGPKLFRHVDWSRRTMTRDGYLHTLRVKDYCHILAGDACLVWHNNILWPFQDMQQRDIRAGDYIRIAIPARGGQTIGGARRVLEISEERRVQRSSRNQSHLQMLFYVIKRHGAQRMLLPRAAGSQYRYLHMDFACNL